MSEELDDRLHDAVALAEIALYADVLTAVAIADHRLTDDEIDAVLGLAGTASTEGLPLPSDSLHISGCAVILFLLSGAGLLRRLDRESPRRRQRMTSTLSRRGTSSPMTGAPGSSPATSSPPEVCASASSSRSSSLAAPLSVCGSTHSRLRRLPPGI
jgi:hypothetical protein